MNKHCDEHSGIVKCVDGLKKEVDQKIWPAIRSTVPRWTFILIGMIIIAFGLILIRGNSSAIEKNTVKIECLKTMAADIKDIKAVVVP